MDTTSEGFEEARLSPDEAQSSLPTIVNQAHKGREAPAPKPEKNNAGVAIFVRSDRDRSHHSSLHSDHSHHIDLASFSNSSSGGSPTSPDRQLGVAEDESSGSRRQRSRQRSRHDARRASRSATSGTEGSRSPSSVELCHAGVEEEVEVEDEEDDEEEEVVVEATWTGGGPRDAEGESWPQAQQYSAVEAESPRCRHKALHHPHHIVEECLSPAQQSHQLVTETCASPGPAGIEGSERCHSHTALSDLNHMVAALDHQILMLFGNLKKLQFASRSSWSPTSQSIDESEAGNRELREGIAGDNQSSAGTAEELYYDCLPPMDSDDDRSFPGSQLTSAVTSAERSTAGWPQGGLSAAAAVDSFASALQRRLLREEKAMLCHHDAGAAARKEPEEGGAGGACAERAEEGTKEEEEKAAEDQHARPAAGGQPPLEVEPFCDLFTPTPCVPPSSPELNATAAGRAGLAKSRAAGLAGGTVRSESDGGVGERSQGGRQMSPQQRQKQVLNSLRERLAATVGNARSLPSLCVRLPVVAAAGRASDAQSVVEPAALSGDHHHHTDASPRRGPTPSSCGPQPPAVHWEAQQLLEQCGALHDTWNSHRLHLRELLTGYKREAERASGLEQVLSRYRQTISALKRQRQELHECMELKELELQVALRRHKNENSLLRNRLLASLNDRKSSLAEAKCEHSRLVPVLDTLLCLHLNREHFMALDIAKQNKINEMALLIRRQQLAIEGLREDKAELHHALAKLMQFLPEGGKTGLPANLPRPAAPHHCRGLTLSEVLYCERSFYLPRTSTSPELAAVSVFQVGGPARDGVALLSAPEGIFDASRQTCEANGDHLSSRQQQREAGGLCSSNNNSDPPDDLAAASLAHDLLGHLTLHGPGSPAFTLVGVNQ